jgi:hypothetical protein
LRGGEADEATQRVSLHLKGSGSFLKKRTKKLLLMRAFARLSPQPPQPTTRAPLSPKAS